MKQIIIKTALYFFIKYVLFYLILAFRNDDFYFFIPSNMTDFWYWYLLLSLPGLMFLLFCGPFIYIFRNSNRLLFILILIGYILIEYVLYTYLASTSSLSNGLYNALISLLVFIVIFGKQTYVKFTKDIRPSTF